MANASIKTSGNIYEVRLTWNGQITPITSSNGTWIASISDIANENLYCLTAWGPPGQPWGVEVSAGAKTNKHKGIFSPGGMDTTGDTSITTS